MVLEPCRSFPLFLINSNQTQFRILELLLLLHCAAMTSQFQQLSVTASDASSLHHFCLKLLIKFQEYSYLLWNQQVESVILTQRVHKIVVNPCITMKFKTIQDQVEGKISDEYETWIVQD